MTNENYDLGTLINNESFLRWLRGLSSSSETKKWQDWHNQSLQNRKLTEKASKIVSMPFKHPDISFNEVKTEKAKFERHFLRLVK